MAVERVQWQCPQCDRRYAIPAHVPTPELCPQCQDGEERHDALLSADASLKERRPPETTTVTTPNVTFPPVPDEPSGMQPVSVEKAADDRTWSTARNSRKYPALQTIAFIYKCFAAFALVTSIAVFLYAVVSVMRAEDQSQRWFAAFMGIGALVGGAFGGVALLSVSEFIRVLLDIERNTRQR